jgi:protein-S-isoprenylcysteine O-methyltransferase Ste14
MTDTPPVFLTHPKAIWRRLLSLDNNIFGIFICATAAYDWRILYQGLDGVTLLYSNGVYALPTLSTLSIFVSALYLTCAGITLLRLREPVSRYSRAAPNLLAMAAAFATYLFIWMPHGTLLEVNVYVAYSFLLCGTFVMLTSLIYLRGAFSVTPQARLLITTGPYAVIRHPMYTGSLLSLLGLALLIDSAEAMILVFVCGCLQIGRALLEENILEASFPEYTDYKTRVDRFIPRLRFDSKHGRENFANAASTLPISRSL